MKNVWGSFHHLGKASGCPYLQRFKILFSIKIARIAKEIDVLTPNWSLLSHQICFRAQDWTVLTGKGRQGTAQGTEDSKGRGQSVSPFSLHWLPLGLSLLLCTEFPRLVSEPFSGASFTWRQCRVTLAQGSGCFCSITPAAPGQASSLLFLSLQHF